MLNFIFAFIKILFILFLFFIVYNVSRLYFMMKKVKEQSEEMFTDDRTRKTYTEGDTVKCNECGSYVAAELSIAVNKNGEELYFCSPECKDTNLNNK